MRKAILAATVLVGVLVLTPSLAPGHGASSDQSAATQSGPALETLLKAVLEGVDGTEVIVSRVTIPPNTSLPKHWHPGEEFAYILEGSVTLWQKDKDEVVCEQGDAVMVPLKQVHTAITKAEGATILVFRVHELGEPERIPVEDD
ncbi:MAG: cupin domain-containing protein [Planctomycetota bacterium]